MVVDRQGTEAEAGRSIGVVGQVPEGVGVVPEVHQRQMGAKVHGALCHVPGPDFAANSLTTRSAAPGRTVL